MAESESIGAGGAQVSIAHMIKAFKNEGWLVSLDYTTRTHGPSFAQALSSLDLEATPDLISETRRPSGRLSTYRMYLYYRNLIKNSQASDVILRAHGYPWLSTISRVPYLVYVQDLSVATNRRFMQTSNRVSTYSAYMLPVRNRLQSSGSNAIFVANSRFIKNLIDKTWQKDSFVIPPPVNARKFQALSHSEKKQNKIVSIGRFSLEKNQSSQVEIARVLSASGIDFRLVIIGSVMNYDSRMILQQIRSQVDKFHLNEKVRVLDNAGANEIASELSTSSIILHTCATEAFGLAVAEAMFAGCTPCVARGGGIVEFVPHELSFESTDQAVSILTKLIKGWRPLSIEQLQQTVANYDVGKFHEKWVELVKQKVA